MDDHESCHLGEKFLISCNESSNFQPPKAFLRRSDIQVTNISLDGELTIMQYVARDCYDKLGNSTAKNDPSIRMRAKTISSTKNKFVAIGCDTNAFVQANRVEERYATGCISFCNSTKGFNESCSGSGCCKAPIAGGLKDITVNVFSYYNHTGIWRFNPCSYAFVVEESKFNFSLEMLQKMDNEPELPELPMVINWAIGDDDKSERCDEAQKRDNYTCKQNTKCLDVDDGSGGYRCQCLEGFEGNPYHPDGCRDIDECKHSSRCHPGECNNLPGRWECKCPKRYSNNGTACTKSNNANRSDRLLLLYIPLANELEGLVNLDKHPWGKVDLCGEENEYLLGSPSITYENSSGESGFRTNNTATIGYDSMQSQMLSPYYEVR
ncbi:hypothetical protein FEM48_Zijuj01G0104600 [Ziziphus jujuba var. spinosa]|uniref:Wall-associated receptor kinase 2-like n=1 Tax=Ziziphus jujuba var. spinosa TaxID=714518 RepID=A0A978W0Q7_ZIZJJ|nr:hypothetical protein FEM48_Zijuj01G0104600 [Ziziphus jujuba var. spinosa]